MSSLSTLHHAPHRRLTLTAALIALCSVVMWVLAGIIDDSLYLYTGALGVIAFGLGLKARRDATRAGEKSPVALAATVVGGAAGAAVIVAVIVWAISQAV